MTAAGTKSERGASTLEFVLTMPFLLLFLTASVQVGLVAHAQNVARAAADEGASRARAFDGSATAAQDRTEEYLARLAGGVLPRHAVDVDRTDTTARVTVTGSVISLVPGWAPTVSQSSEGPVERFVEAVP